METLAILAAAGRGERMGGDRPKAFLSLAGETLIVRSARAVGAAGCTDGIVAVVPADELGVARELLSSVAKLRAVVAGGARRQDSVLEGLKQAPAGFNGIVIVHDAARPFVDVRLVEAVVEAARRSGAAVPVLGLVDTVKRVGSGRVVETLDRSELGGAQTPQAFHYPLLLRAYQQASRDGVTVSDEAAAVERLGETVVTVPGSSLNRKLTTHEDLLWAEWLIQHHAPEAEA
jgi:2-C-methyl-D-erythritol 4-phosphate cytidylyltransferase